MVIARQLISPLLLGLAVILAGCASNKVVMSQDEFLLAMGVSSQKVDALLERGGHEEAVRILVDLAKTNPDRKEPWGRMAKIQFDSGNYAQAIVSAEEVLQRDGTDRTAKSIRAVAGLRVAAQSLADLRNDVELKGNTRSDAVSLANVMRDTLGEEVLVPPAELEARKKREAAAANKARWRAKPAQVPAAQGGKASAGMAGDPFSQLK